MAKGAEEDIDPFLRTEPLERENQRLACRDIQFVTDRPAVTPWRRYLHAVVDDLTSHVGAAVDRLPAIVRAIGHVGYERQEGTLPPSPQDRNAGSRHIPAVQSHDRWDPEPALRHYTG